MGIALGSNFDVQTNLPLDSRLKVADTTARDAIDSGVRYEGMLVYVVADGTNYQLVGGIDNANWAELSGSGGGGGAGTPTWFVGSPGPEPGSSTAIRFRVFPAGESLYVNFDPIRVPDNYEPGMQIRMHLSFQTNGASGNIKFIIKTALINSSSIIWTSRVNEHTSAYAGEDLTAGGIYNPAIDLCDESGEINGVAVAPGDYLVPILERDSADTSTEDALWVEAVIRLEWDYEAP